MLVPPSVVFSPLQYFERIDADAKIAYRLYKCPEERKCGLMYLEGLENNMQGMRSRCFEVESQMRLHIDCLRFDFQGQGDSTGDLERASICQWTSDALDVLDHICGRQPQILVGSSLGAWVALQVAVQRPQRIKAVVLISPAVDITEVWRRGMSPEEVQQATATGRVHLPEAFAARGAWLPLTFFQSARQSLLMEGPARCIPVDCPVRIFHGLEDKVAPPSLSRELTEKLHTDDVHITLIKDGNHQLSRPQDLSAVFASVTEMVDY